MTDDATSQRVRRGAVLYDTREPYRRPCCSQEGRCLAYVMNVYENADIDGDVLYDIYDGTFTTQEYVNGEDLLAEFEPAGWSVDPRYKPTYILTREHGVEDHHDLMQRANR